MKNVLMAICTILVLQVSTPRYLHAQEDIPQENLKQEELDTQLEEEVTDEEESTTSESIQTEMPRVSPFLLIFALVSVGIFISLGYYMIKYFKL